jgi:hypothetical protein
MSPRVAVRVFAVLNAALGIWLLAACWRQGLPRASDTFWMLLGAGGFFDTAYGLWFCYPRARKKALVVSGLGWFVCAVVLLIFQAIWPPWRSIRSIFIVRAAAVGFVLFSIELVILTRPAVRALFDVPGDKPGPG